MSRREGTSGDPVQQSRNSVTVREKLIRTQPLVQYSEPGGLVRRRIAFKVAPIEGSV
jgi:hypothetical protein